MNIYIKIINYGEISLIKKSLLSLKILFIPSILNLFYFIRFNYLILILWKYNYYFI